MTVPRWSENVTPVVSQPSLPAVFNAAVGSCPDGTATSRYSQGCRTARVRTLPELIVTVGFPDTCTRRGIPDVAFSMVQMGLTLGDTLTALDLEEGLDLLEHWRGTP